MQSRALMQGHVLCLWFVLSHLCVIVNNMIKMNFIVACCRLLLVITFQLSLKAVFLLC